MNVKLNRVIEEIEKTETKIAELQGNLKKLRSQRVQLEDQEIIKTFRAMQLPEADRLRLLYGIQDGSVRFVTDDDKAEIKKNKNCGSVNAAESEDSTHEKVD